MLLTKPTLTNAGRGCPIVHKACLPDPAFVDMRRGNSRLHHMACWAVTSVHVAGLSGLLHTARQQPEQPHAWHAKSVYGDTRGFECSTTTGCKRAVAPAPRLTSYHLHLNTINTYKIVAQHSCQHHQPKFHPLRYLLGLSVSIRDAKKASHGRYEHSLLTEASHHTRCLPPQPCSEPWQLSPGRKKMS